MGLSGDELRVGTLKGEGFLPDNVPCQPVRISLNVRPPRHHRSTLRNDIQDKFPKSQKH